MGERLVKWHANEQISDGDLSKMGAFARASLDHVVLDAIEPGKKFSGFQVVQSGPAKVSVASGRYYAGGKVFFRDQAGGVELDLAANLPAVVNKIVTVVVWGVEVDTAVEPRTFLTDVDTEQTSADAVPTENQRVANIDRVAGAEGSDPIPPALDANVLGIADIELSPTGIVSIVARAENRLPSVAENAAAIADLAAWREGAGGRLDALDSALAAIEDRISDLPTTDLVLETARDVARLKEQAQQPESFTSYGADRFLDSSGSDVVHIDYLSTVQEGIRFPPVNERVAQLALLNPINPKVTVKDGFAFPNYSEVVRDRVKGRDGELSIAQFPYQTVEIQQRKASRTRVRFGSTRTVSASSAWWRSGRFDPITGVFRRSSEAWTLGDAEVVEQSRGFVSARFPKYWEDAHKEVYWNVDVTTENFSGSTVMESFLNAEDGYLTGLGLRFTRVAATGALHVLIARVENGEPRLDDIVARVTVPAADLVALPERTWIPFSPTFLEKGRRYAFVIITAGNHFLATVKGNKAGQGALFYVNAGAVIAGDIDTDIPFALRFAEFKNPRVEVELQPIELAGGIADIDVNLDNLRPTGTKLSFQVQIGGAWVPLGRVDGNPLIGLPPLLPFRAVLTGTTQVMPAIGVGGRSEVITTRPRAEFVHVSTARTLPAPCDTVVLTLRLESFDEAHHNCTAELRTGGAFATVELPDTVVDKPTGVAGSIERVFTFNTASAISTFKIVVEGETDNLLTTFHVADRADVSYS